MTRKVNRWLRSKAGTRIVAGILALLVVVLVAGFVFGWWSALGDWLSGASSGFWKGVPKTADHCVTTYRFADKAPLDKACFDRTKLAPGYNDCGADGCYVKKLDADQWYRTDEVNVTVP